MIIIRLIGGLGNQMFEYAMAKNLAIKNNCELKIDISWLNKEKNKFKMQDLYGLKHFNLKTEIATKEEIMKLKLFEGISGKLFKQVNKCLSYKYKRIVVEKAHEYMPKMKKTSDNTYIEFGYWSCYKYFEKIENKIKKEFSFKKEITNRNLKLVNKIKNNNSSISLHVRRGDYVNNPIYNTFGLEYYHRSAKFICNKVKDPTFYIFSDDIEWTKKNLELNCKMVFIEENQKNTLGDGGHNDKGIYDMYLMSLCKHNITANSSFSWWGAWLNKNNKKIICTPKIWFNDIKNDSLIPKNWVKL